jgi:hypothetical protein
LDCEKVADALDAACADPMQLAAASATARPTARFLVV